MSQPGVQNVHRKRSWPAQRGTGWAGAGLHARIPQEAETFDSWATSGWRSALLTPQLWRDCVAGVTSVTLTV